MHFVLPLQPKFETRSAFAVGEKSLSSILIRECPYCGSTSGLLFFGKNFPSFSFPQGRGGKRGCGEEFRRAREVFWILCRACGATLHKVRNF